MKRKTAKIKIISFVMMLAFLFTVFPAGSLRAVAEDGESAAFADTVPVTVSFTEAGPLMKPVTVETGSKVRSLLAQAYSLTAAQDEQTENGLILNKTAEQTSDGYKIALEAYVTGSVVTTTTTTPADIVLVLDQSGSMAYDFSGSSTNTNADRRQYAMKQAVNSFITAVNEKYSADADHRMAIVTFGSSAETLQGWTLVDDNGKNTLQTQINGLPNSPSGATNVAAGMSQADTLMGSGYSYSGANTLRQKVVIVFTDGVPTTATDFNTTVATDAIVSAKNLKDAGATVYSVGIFNGANPDELNGNEYVRAVIGNISCDGSVGTFWGGTNIAQLVTGDVRNIDTPAGNRFLNYLSNNFVEATEIGITNNYDFPGLAGGDGWYITKNFTRTDTRYYLTADDSAKLNNIFQSISQQIGGASMELDETTVVKDIISPYFTVPENTSDIKLYTAVCTGEGTGGMLTFDTPTVATGVTASITDDNTLSVSGFDFAANFCGKNDNTYQGQKLIIEFTVTLRDGFLGGNAVPTNGETSGVYTSDGTLVETFDVPKVDVPVPDVSVNVVDKNVYLLHVPTQEELLSGGVTVKMGNTALDLLAENYGLEEWQTAYVNIDVTAAPAAGFDATADSSTYTVTASVVPKETGAIVGKESSDTQDLFVYKPVVAWKDSEIDLGASANYGDNFVSVEWKHGEISAVSGTMLGSEPVLDYSYDPAAAAFTADTPVNVKTYIGEREVTEYATYEHSTCTFDGCTWDETNGYEFIVHIKSCMLTVIKKGCADIDENQTFLFDVEGNGIKLTVAVHGNSSVTVTDLPVGTYTVTEKTDWSWRYIPEKAEQQVQAVAGNNVVTFANERKNTKWLDGGCYKNNIYGVSTEEPSESGN